MGVKALVTGYIPIQGHPRSAAEYGALGENMFGGLRGDFYVHPFYETVGDTWLTKAIQRLPNNLGLSHSKGDNPQKNTLAYHCVQHQKFAWLLKAQMLNPAVETLVWVDYGIGHVPGVTSDVVNDFMANVKDDDFAIPGCLERANMILNDDWPCWRFCGGLMVVPARMALPLYTVLRKGVLNHMQRKHNVTWEVNSLARVEKKLPIPPRWYLADHNQTMFTNYGEPPCPSTASSPVSVAPSAATSTPT